MMHNGPILVVVGTGVAAIGLCSVPAATSLVTNLFTKERKDDRIYEDGDGKATTESVKAFNIWPAKALVLSLAVAGTILSAVLLATSLHGDELVVEECMSTAAWVCLNS